jgi:four helix bundle protein
MENMEDQADNIATYPFEKLEVYQLARQLRRQLYSVAKGLHPEERYNLARQLRSAARSLTNNITEGAGRYTFRDRIHFMHMARRSLTELMDDLTICEDQEYVDKEALAELQQQTQRLYRAISGFVNCLERQKNRD